MSIGAVIGARGEALFIVLMTQFRGRQRPYFRAHYLGGKFVALDYLIELVDAPGLTPYFFVQVKTTTQGYTKGTGNRRRLKVQVAPEDMQRLIRYPAPTYLIGIDERAEIGYIVAAHAGSPDRFSSLPTVFPLTCDTMAQLWDEVLAFWQQRDITFATAVFSVTNREDQR